MRVQAIVSIKFLLLIKRRCLKISGDSVEVCYRLAWLRCIGIIMNILIHLELTEGYIYVSLNW